MLITVLWSIVGGIKQQRQFWWEWVEQAWVMFTVMWLCGWNQREKLGPQSIKAGKASYIKYIHGILVNLSSVPKLTNILFKLLLCILEVQLGLPWFLVQTATFHSPSLSEVVSAYFSHRPIWMNDPVGHFTPASFQIFLPEHVHGSVCLLVFSECLLWVLLVCFQLEASVWNSSSSSGPSFQSMCSWNM